MRASIKKIRLLANFNDPSTIRDWVLPGRDIGDFSISLVDGANGNRTTSNSTSTINATSRLVTDIIQYPEMKLPLSYNATTGNFTCNASVKTITTNQTQILINGTWNTSNTTVNTSNSTNATFTTNSITTWADPEPVPAPARSYGRIDPQLKSVSSLGAPTSPWPSFSNNATFSWASYGNSTWGSIGTISDRQGYGFLGFCYHIHGEALNTGSARLFTGNSSWTRNNLIPGDPLPSTGFTEALNFHFFHVRGAWFLNDNGIQRWPYYFKGTTNETRPDAGSTNWDSGFVFTDSIGNRIFMAPGDLGTVATNYPWRRLRMQVQPRNEISSADGGGNMTSQSLIPDWAMLDVISFGMNSTTIPLNFSTHVNLNNKFITPNGTLTSNRSQALESLLLSLDNVSAADGFMFRNPYGLAGNSSIAWNSVTGNYARVPSPDTTCYDQLGGASSNSTWAQLITRNIGNMTWSPSSLWGSNNTATSKVRKSKGFPENQLVLPSEVAEIRDIADLVSTNSTTFLSSTRYTNAARHIKSNELRLSPFFPGATTCSNFFTVYAYAQALDKLGNIDSEALTKTLVEVEITAPATATTAAQYKVKKLYTQPIPLGQ